MRIRLGMIVGAMALGACAAPPAAVATPERAVRPIAQPPTIALEREIRYYRDESGALWDDRGKRVGAQP